MKTRFFSEWESLISTNSIQTWCCLKWSSSQITFMIIMRSEFWLVYSSNDTATVNAVVANFLLIFCFTFLMWFLILFSTASSSNICSVTFSACIICLNHQLSVTVKIWQSLTIQSRRVFSKEALSTNELSQSFIDWELSVWAVAESVDSDIQWCALIWSFKTDSEMWRQLVWQLKIQSWHTLQVYNSSKIFLSLLFLSVINFLFNFFTSKYFHQYTFFLIFGFSFRFKDIEKEERIKLSCSINADETCTLFVEFSWNLFWEQWEVAEIDHSCISYELNRQ